MEYDEHNFRQHTSPDTWEYDGIAVEPHGGSYHYEREQDKPICPSTGKASMWNNRMGLPGSPAYEEHTDKIYDWELNHWVDMEKPEGFIEPKWVWEIEPENFYSSIDEMENGLDKVLARVALYTIENDIRETEGKLPWDTCEFPLKLRKQIVEDWDHEEVTLENTSGYSYIRYPEPEGPNPQHYASNPGFIRIWQGGGNPKYTFGVRLWDESNNDLGIKGAFLEIGGA